MKRVFKNVLTASVLLIFVGACKEDTLVFPPPVEEEFDSDRVIDVVAKPSDVWIVGEYDYNFRFKWPKISDKVAKIVVEYLEDDVVKSKEFSDFSQDGIIETSSFGVYPFLLTTHGKNGQVSKPVGILAANKGYIIEEVLASPLINELEGEIEVKLVNNNEVPIKTTITYPGTSGDLTKVVNSSDETIVVRFPMQDGTHNYTVELEDGQGRKVSSQYSYSFTYIVNSTVYADYGVGRLTYNNNAGSPITLKVTYPVSGGTTTVEQSFTGSNVTFNFVPVNGTHQVSVEYKDAGGRARNDSFTYTHNPFVFKTYLTGADKSGWSVTVSSNATNDGTGPAALLDGAANTYWHTPWSGEIPPWPHFATITFNKKIQLTKMILMIRHNNGNGSPKNIDLQVSADGANFTTHESFVNSVSTAGATLNFTIANPVETRYVRVLCRDNIANSSSMALAEISFEGNEKL